MKKLLSYDYSFIISKVYESDELKRKFIAFVGESELDFIGDILSDIDGCEYEFNIFNNNWLFVTNPLDFFNTIKDTIDSFNGSEDMVKDWKRASKLINSNLFASKVDQLGKSVYEWINELCDHIESIINKIENNTIDGETLMYLETYGDNFLDNIYLNEQNELLKIEKL